MKGFVGVLEAFLAVSLMFIVLSQVQINIPAGYSDTTNIDRLHRCAHDIAFSVCGNLKDRRAIVNDTFAFDLENNIPTDIGYHIYVYANSSSSHLMDTLVYNYGDAVSSPAATSSCLIAGGPNATNYSVSACSSSGISCLSSIIESDDSRINLDENDNFTLQFTPPRNGSIVELVLEGYHNQSGATYLYDSAGHELASYGFSSDSDEVHAFDLTDALPDENNLYNVSVMAHGINASYDYAYLNVSENIYSPRQITVQTWNIGG